MREDEWDGRELEQRESRYRRLCCAGVRAPRRLSGGRWWVLAAGVLMGACGDDGAAAVPDGATADAAPPEAGADTSVREDAAPSDGGVDARSPDGAITDAAFDASSPDGAADACAPHLLVVASDFVSTKAGMLDLESGQVRVADDPLAEQDTVPGHSRCSAFLLERATGVLRWQSSEDPLVTVDTWDLDPPSASMPYASNPQKVVPVSDSKAYVLMLARNELLVIDPTEAGSEAMLGTIDLSSRVKGEDADGLVDVLDAVVVDGRLVVALGHTWFDQDFQIHFGGSELVVIDPEADVLVDLDPEAEGLQGIELVGENPWRGLVIDGARGTLLVGATGDSFARDGVIEEVDLDAGESLGPILEEATLDAEVEGFAPAGGMRLLVLAGGDLVLVDPDAEPIDPQPIASGVAGVITHRASLFAWIRDGAEEGLHRYALGDGSETTPGEGPWTFGDLPIAAVSVSP